MVSGENTRSDKTHISEICVRVDDKWYRIDHWTTPELYLVMFDATPATLHTSMTSATRLLNEMSSKEPCEAYIRAIKAPMLTEIVEQGKWQWKEVNLIYDPWTEGRTQE